MNYLIFDTETTGLPRKYAKPGDDNQARVLQLACIHVDENFKRLAQFVFVIKPDGWTTVDPGAEKVHGISFAMCQQRGVDMKMVLSILRDLANASSIIIAHNIKFDQQMLDIECDYHGVNRIIVHNATHKLFCTMIHTTDICNIPHPTWPGKNKWPKVKEAFKHFYGKEPEDQHDALGDVIATVEIFKMLQAKNIVQQALAL